MRARAIGIVGAFSAFMMAASAATAQICNSPDALGTSRVLKIDTSKIDGFGTSFGSLPLARGEIVLTFDDGPVSESTSRILDALSWQCVRATFFMIGRRAEALPQLVARVRDDGHTIGSHSYSHRNLDALSHDQAVADIQRGYEAVETAAFGSRSEDRPRLFRFPSYKSTPELVSFVRARRGTVASWDLSSQDWRGDAPAIIMDRVRRLLERRDRGVLSFHDNQKNTTVVLPMVLAEIRARGLRVVHLVPE
jgi:peptidoglycan/xylan/chitin deacetylase (PgdA/CDA1 family)